MRWEPHRLEPRRRRTSMPARPLRPCGVCGSTATQTILIAVNGLALLKDLCEMHLSSLLDGARDSTTDPSE
jgi:hypothetical protein